MKKLLLIAISLLIFSAGNVFANESQVSVEHRHGVWTNWFDENGNRLPDTIAEMKEERMKAQNVSTGKNDEGAMDTKTGKFDFIQETKSYDYNKDNGNSA